MSDDFEDYSDDEARLSQRPGRARASGQGDGDTGGYKMKGALKAPRPTSYTTQALFGTHVQFSVCAPGPTVSQTK